MSTSSEEDTVLSLYYQGYTRSKIHNKTGISTGKISGFVAAEKKRLGAAVVAAIRRVGKELNRTGMTWDDVADAVAMSNFCKKQSLDFEELKEVLPQIVEKLNEHGLQLSDLPVDIDEKVKEKDELHDNVEDLKTEISQLGEVRTKKLKDAGHTEESIARCRELTDSLIKYGLPTDAPEKLRNAISNAEENGFDGRAIGEKISSIKSLDEEKKALEKAIGAKQDEFQDAELAVDGQRIEFAGDKEAIDAIKLLKEKGVKTTDILAIKYLVDKEGSDLPALSSKVAKYGSLDKTIQESEKLVKDLEKRKGELEPAVEVLQQRKTSLETFLKENEETLKKRMQSIIDAANDVVTKTTEAGNEASKKIMAIGEKAESVTKRYEKTHGVVVFGPLIRSLNGEKVDVSEVRDAAVFAMTILLSVFPPGATYRYALEAVIKNVKEDVSFGI